MNTWPALSLVVYAILVLPSPEHGRASQPGERMFLQDRLGLNKPLLVDYATETVQRMTVMAMDVQQKQLQKWRLELLPQTRDAAGNWVVRVKPLGVSFDIDVGGNKFSTDGPVAANPM